MSFFEFRQSLALLMQRKQQRGNRTGKEQGRRTRRLLLESLEDRKMLAAVTIPWSSQVSYDQFTGGAPKIFGFGVDDGEPDANGDGKSDSSGIQKAPNFFGYDLPNTSFNIGNAVLGANANVSGKFGLQYGYYVNGGSASSIHSGNFSYDVQDTANADTVAINTGVNLNTGNLYTVSPKISGYVDLIARLNGNIAITSGGGSTTVPGDPSPFHLWGPHTITAPTQTWYNLPINVDAGATLLSVNRQVRDASGNPQFLSNGAPQFDGDIQVAGLTPSNKLSIPSNFEQQYADAVGTEKGATIAKAAAKLALSVAQTAVESQAAQAKIDAATTTIANASSTAASLKLKLGQPGKNSYTIASGETGHNNAQDKPEVGGGEVLTFSVGTADGPLLGLKADLGLGVAVGEEKVGLPLGTATITLPDVSLVDTSPDSYGVLSASTNDQSFKNDSNLTDRQQLAKLDLKLGSLLGGEFQVDTGIGTLDATLLQYTLSAQLNVTQSATLTPNVSQSVVTFKFYDAATNTVVNVNATVNGVAQNNVSQIQFTPGAAVTVTSLTSSKVKVVPSLKEGFTFSNNIGLSTTFTGEPSALSASIGSLSVGPVWNPGPTNLFTTDLGTIYSNTFNVQENEVILPSFQVGGPSVDLGLTVVNKPGAVVSNGTPQAATFKLTITNSGPSPATGVVFTDALPTNFTFDAAKSNTGATVANGVVTYNLGNLASGASKTITIGVNVNSSGDVVGSYSTFDVRSGVRERNVSDNHASLRTQVQPPTAIIVDKAGDEDPATLASLTTAQLLTPGQVTFRRAALAATRVAGADLIYIDLKNSGPVSTDVTFGEFIFFDSLTIVNLNDILTFDAKNTSKIFHFGNLDKNDYKLVNISLTGGNGVGEDPARGGALELYDPDGTVPANRDSLTIINSEIHDNLISNTLSDFTFGAGMVVDTADLFLDHVNFYNNQAQYAGALNLSNATSVITNTTFTNNNALTGAGIENYASGPNTGTLNISLSTFTGNTATHGAAIYNHTFENDDPAAIATAKYSKNVFLKNVNTAGEPVILNSQFSGVALTTSEGGSISDDDSPSLTGTGDKKNTISGITLDSLQLVEQTAGAVVGSLGVVHPFMGAPVAYTVSDARFEIVGIQLKLKNANSLTLASTPQVTLTITASDGVLKLTKAFTIIVVKPNLAPTALFVSKTTVNENSVAAVLGTITVTDPNPGDTANLTVSDARFEIVNKQLKLKPGISLDFETTPSITLKITATDSTGLSFNKNVLVTVVNVNETPSSINLSTSSLHGNEVAGVVGTVTATDPDKTTPSLTVSDARFEIVAGKLQLKAGQSINPVTEPTIAMNLVATDSTALKLTKPITIHVAPVVTTSGTASYTENGAAVVIASTAAVAFKAGQNFNKGRLQITLDQANANDRLEIKSLGTAAGQFSAAAGQLKFGGVAIGTYSGGVGTAPLIIDFTTTAATVAATQALLRNITFRTLSEAPVTTARAVTFLLTDGLGGYSAPATNAIKITPVNDAPVLTLSGSISYKRGATALAILATANVTDVDSADFATGKLTVQATSGGTANDTIALGPAFSFVGTDVRLGTTSIGTRNASGGVGTTSLVITFKSTATLAIVKQLVQAITFKSTATATVGNRVLSLSLTDGDGGTGNTTTKTVSVTL